MKMEFSEVSVKDSPGLCRCCLSEGCYKDLGTEYTWMNETEVYADMLLDCFDVGITQHNDGPNGPKRLICEVCITRLRDACNFKKQVLDSEKRFIDMLGRGEFRSKVLIYQEQLKSEAVEVSLDDMDTAAEVEYLDDIDFQPDDMEPLSTIKRELPCSSSTEAPRKRGRPRKDTTEAPERKIKKTDVKKNKITKDFNITAKEVNRTEQRRINFRALMNNTTLTPFKFRGKYSCFFCGTDIHDYPTLKHHTETHKPISNDDRDLYFLKRCDLEIKTDISEVKCNICLDNFKTVNEIIEHLILKHNLVYNKDVSLGLVPYMLKDLKCLECNETKTNFRGLVLHMNKNHATEHLTCEFCSQKYSKTLDLASHIRMFHKKEYKCKKCDKIFTTYNLLYKHKSKAHVSTCTICLKTFPNHRLCLIHMKKKHNTDTATCGFCNKEFRSKNSFLLHVDRCENLKTQDEANELITVEDTEDEKYTKLNEARRNITSILNMTSAMPFKIFHNRFRCFYCPKEYINCCDLTQHTKGEHPECNINCKSMKLRGVFDGIVVKIDISDLFCKLCYEKQSDLNGIVEHLKNNHKVSIGDCIELLQPFKLAHEKFPCPSCGEEFRYFNKLLQHMTIKHSGNRFVCTFCGKSFKADANLRCHISNHHKKDTVKCSQCHLSFHSYNALKIHCGKAHNVKVFKCPVCAEKFVSQYRMNVHLLKIHDRGHKCVHCGTSFIKYSFLDKHIRRTHLNEKNVQCTHCNERFFDATGLKHHMVKHIGERNFSCDHCGRTFLRKRNLRGHMKMHIKEFWERMT